MTRARSCGSLLAAPRSKTQIIQLRQGKRLEKGSPSVSIKKGVCGLMESVKRTLLNPDKKRRIEEEEEEKRRYEEEQRRKEITLVEFYSGDLVIKTRGGPGPKAIEALSADVSEAFSTGSFIRNDVEGMLGIVL
eukprot:CAMPEP_0116833486 /NCGR_PEP_ID=MMETSP0418-20121206/6464_1 /TAXON_ID=1158023 /ORGANISM="Astrosyne radiata, Strain 13vi08-1A" /LENGTH=133 /DNA_ID=CAMNT_0004462943 /DNA_START=1474 /DNA_END=1875 /DNA_ORIENTATION=-